MNVLTIWEGDGSVTRIAITVDAIALKVAAYFREDLGMVTMLANVDDETLPFDDEETERGLMYMNEWRNFSKNKLSVVK